MFQLGGKGLKPSVTSGVAHVRTKIPRRRLWQQAKLWNYVTDFLPQAHSVKGWIVRYREVTYILISTIWETNLDQAVECKITDVTFAHDYFGNVGSLPRVAWLIFQFNSKNLHWHETSKSIWPFKRFCCDKYQTSLRGKSIILKCNHKHK